MSIETFPNPEKESFLDRHKSVMEAMKAVGIGVVEGVSTTVILELVFNLLLRQDVPHAVIVSIGSATTAGGIAFEYIRKKIKK